VYNAVQKLLYIVAIIACINQVYRLRLLRHLCGAYAAHATAESFCCLT
jgi:hypothetical protein